MRGWLGKLLQWVIRHSVIEELPKPQPTEEQKNREEAIRLVRRIKQVKQQILDHRRSGRWWASFDDPWPLPMTQADKKILMRLAFKERIAIVDLELWLKPGRSFEMPLPDELKGWLLED